MPRETVTDVLSSAAVQAAEDGWGPGSRLAGLLKEPQTRQETDCSLVSGQMAQSRVQRKPENQDLVGPTFLHQPQKPFLRSLFLPTGPGLPKPDVCF